MYKVEISIISVDGSAIAKNMINLKVRDLELLPCKVIMKFNNAFYYRNLEKRER